MTHLFLHIKLSARSLSRQPRYIFSAILNLTIALCLVAGLGQVVQAVFIRPLPFPAADRLVIVEKVSATNAAERGLVAGDDAVGWESQLRAVDSIGLARIVRPAVKATSSVSARWVGELTPNLLDMAGVVPQCGRKLTEGDTLPPATFRAMISSKLLDTEFGGQCDRAIGKSITVFGMPFEIVGVLPIHTEIFRYSFGNDVDLVMPVPMIPQVLHRMNSVYLAVARLKTGASIGQLNAELAASASQLTTTFPREWKGWGAHAAPMRDSSSGEVRAVLPVLIAAGIGIAAIATLNLASLLTSIRMSRMQETAMLTALGCGSGLSLQLVLIEAGLLLAAAIPAALIALAAAVRFLPNLLPIGAFEKEQLSVIEWSTPAIAVALAAVLIAALAAVIVSGGFARRPNLGRLLIPGTPGTVGRVGTGRLFQAMAGLQIAVTFVLILSALLLLRSYQAVDRVPLGYDPSGTISLSMQLPHGKYDEAADQAKLVEAVRSRLGGIASITAVATAGNLPSEKLPLWKVRFALPGAETHLAQMRSVSANFFDVLSIRRLETAPGSGTATRGVFVNQSLRALLDTNGSHASGPMVLADFGTQPLPMLGVVADTRSSPYEAPMPAIYVLRTDSTMYFLIHSKDQTPEALRAMYIAIREVEPEAVVEQPEALSVSVDQGLSPARTRATVLTAIAALALLLAFLGVQGAMLEAIAQRRREVAVRTALGATPFDIVTLVAGLAFRPLAAGLCVGIVMYMVSQQVLEKLLFGVAPLDPVSWAIALGTLALAAPVATLPAIFEALRSDPNKILRS